MGSSTGVTDLGSQYLDFERSTKDYRPLANTVYTPGSLLQFASLDTQPWPDAKGAQLSAIAANQQSLLGFVADTWPGFNGSIGTPNLPANYTSPVTLTALRGTLDVNAVTQGYHPGVLLDQSGSGAVTVVDKLSLIASRATVGYVQGGSASAPAGGTAVVANAVLPASGIGSSLTAAALAQASQTDTIAGTPAVGDTLSVTIQSPYVSSAPGVAQTTTWTTPPLTTAQAVSVTTAAAALVAYLNAQANFSKYFTATNLVGVVTVTVNAAAALFNVNFGSGTTETANFSISISGMVANSLTFAVAATGGSTATAGAANLASGTGYKGVVPALVTVGGGT